MDKFDFALVKAGATHPALPPHPFLAPIIPNKTGGATLLDLDLI